MGTVASIHDRVTDVGAYLREQRETARLSVRQLAQLAGVSNPYLSQVERGLRKPSAEMLQQIAKGLRISAEALYVRAGILDEELRVGVERAVHGDPELTDRQKRVLLDIYASFRAENLRAAAEDVAASVPRRRPSTRTTSSVPKPAKRSARKTAAAEPAERPARPRRRAKAAAAPAVQDVPADVTAEATVAQAVAPDATDATRPAAKRATRRTTKRAAAGNAAGVARRAVKRTSRSASSATGPTPSATTETP